jgi:drug/metabolite transporter (DMT)-like permease
MYHVIISLILILTTAPNFLTPRYISHTCYIFMIPLQLVAEYIQQHHNSKNSVYQNMIETINTSTSSVYQSLLELQYRVQGNQVFPLGFIIKTSLWLSILLTLPAYIWYLSVNLTSMSNLTAIYNTGCFFAYLFSILMLHDRLVAAKVGAIMLCMAGVLAMACWPQTSNNNDDESRDGIASTGKEWVGIAVASIGAALYGFYEVYYKKYASPSQPTILFANTITGVIGVVTFLVLWIPFPLLHFTGIETFELPDWITFGYIMGIASMSVIYNATFMAVIALVNPVFAAVGVMLTVPAVAITDVLVTGVMVPTSTIVGSFLILIGFIVLNRQVGIDEKIDQSLSLEGQYHH